MAFGSRKASAPEPPIKPTVPKGDPTAWLVDSEVAHFLLLHTFAIKYMCMVGYTYLHGKEIKMNDDGEGLQVIFY
jgi:hypothetical protein